MSALEEYRKNRCGNIGVYWTQIRDEADAAIAELEAELRKWKADFSAMEQVALDHESELAALKARRCEGCAHGEYADHVPPEVYCGYHSTWWACDQFCSEWQARP